MRIFNSDLQQEEETVKPSNQKRKVRIKKDQICQREKGMIWHRQKKRNKEMGDALKKQMKPVGQQDPTKTEKKEQNRAKK